MNLPPPLSADSPHPRPWRRGRKVSRNVYGADDQPVLMAPDDDTAALIVEAVNLYARMHAMVEAGETA